MKVIDLLNKIANGEEIPKKIKRSDVVYTYDGYKGEIGYVNKEGERYKWFIKEIDCDIENDLNSEIEVIEDNDDLEPIPDDELQQIEGLDKKKHNIALDWNFRVLKDKINELVKEINEIRKNG